MPVPFPRSFRTNMRKPLYLFTFRPLPSVPLQLAQAFGQHGGGDADDFAFQLAVPQGLILRVRDVPYSTGIAACGSVP